MSSLLSRYVIRAVLGTTLLVMLVLLTLSGLYIFITQQDEIGVGTYTLEDAFLFVGLNLPKYAFDMLPIAALIGALLALDGADRGAGSGRVGGAHRDVGCGCGRHPDAAHRHSRRAGRATDGELRPAHEDVREVSRLQPRG
jgi:hypothetical protein